MKKITLKKITLFKSSRFLQRERLPLKSMHDPLYYAAIAAFIINPLSAPRAAATTRALPSTQIIRYQPTFNPNLPQKKGYCWTDSIASTRADAFRCMVGNSIFDPCFKVPGRAQVICDVDPLKPHSGFNLQLTQPLPPHTTTPSATAVQPWLVFLKDGTSCAPATGTLPFVGQQTMRYYCTWPTSIKSSATLIRGLFGIDSQTMPWTATVGLIDTRGKTPQITKQTQMPVVRAYE